METITLRLKTVTPLFLGGALPGTAELRAASIRGVLRFWARAVLGGELGDDIPAISARESNLFGATDKASPLVVRVATEMTCVGKGDRRFSGRDSLRNAKIAGAAYLGYGAVESVPQRGFLNSRPFFDSGGSVTVRLQWRDDPGAQAEKDLEKILWCWLRLGGLGSKSRKGYGSLCCHDSTPELAFVAPRTRYSDLVKDLSDNLTAFRGDRRDAVFSRFSPAANISLVGVRQEGGAGNGPLEPFSTPMNALEAVGILMIAFRRRRGVNAGPGLPEDYQWAWNPGTHGHIPSRAGFGLPLPFGKKTTIQGESATRRASPLLIHIERCGDGFYPILTHLPAPLLPDGEKLAYASPPRTTESEARGQTTIISEFLNWANAPAPPAQWNDRWERQDLGDVLATLQAVTI